MGFFDFFRKKPKIAPEDLRIDISENKMIINGKGVDIPCHLSVLTKFLGKPRKFVGKHRENINFIWDALGINCYTKGNRVVYCIGVKANVGDIKCKTDPKSTFKGKLTIAGEDWEETMLAGEDLEVGRRRVYHGYSLFAEFADMENCDKNGCRGAYSGIEIQLD